MQSRTACTASGFIVCSALALSLVGCDSAPTHTYLLPIPTQLDWKDCGTIFHGGVEGEWDHYLWGGFASTVVKKDGIFYLYYQGSKGYDNDEGTDTWRAIGVATSRDGISFTKYSNNPVLTWFPKNNLEEGAVSGGAFLDDNGDIALYYGANTWAGGDQVSADGRLAVSSDGFNFSDLGVVLDHTEGSAWGSGDELFPILGFHDSGRWFVYYIPNGTPQRGQLGVAWGNSRINLTHSSAAQSGGAPVPVWGPGGYARVGPEVYALFLSNVRGSEEPTLEVRTVTRDTPNSLSAPVETYRFDNIQGATVFLDSDTNRWFMYYRGSDHNRYRVKVAPAGERQENLPLGCGTSASGEK